MKEKGIDIENNVNVNEIKIIIADDDIRTCEEIKEKLQDHANIEVIGIANTDAEEIRMIEELKPDVVITDLMRGRSFTGLDIIKDYAEKENSPKFIIVSFTPEAGLAYRYKNVADSVSKTPKINGSELAYKILCAKRIIWRERQDFIENQILEDKNRNTFWGKLKRLLIE